jgi:glycosyltransferase involved in cell wall biosynthesis
MTVCFFGISDPLYARNRVLMEGLRAHGARVLECRADPREFRGFAKYFELYRQYRLVRREDISFVLVAFPGQTVAWLARLLFGRGIVLDAFLSLYDSNVFDRKTHRPGSFAAGLDWFWDWSSIRLAKLVLLDTEQHIEYFVRTFRAPRTRFLRVWIGADEATFSPRMVPLKPRFTVHFHGTFIPLQGISYILDAAALLADEEIEFRIVGSGQQFAAIQAKAKRLSLANVSFEGMKPLADIPRYIASAHVSLGIFGNTEKTGRVIPNKVFEQLAMGAATITADTPAIRELEAYGELPLALVPVADAPALASAIRALRSNEAVRRSLGERARKLFEGHLTARMIVGPLLESYGRGFTPALAKATL